MLDPRLANHQRVRQSPSNGYFSARALAKFFDTLPFIYSPGVPECAGACVGPRALRVTACHCTIQRRRTHAVWARAGPPFHVVAGHVVRCW